MRLGATQSAAAFGRTLYGPDGGFRFVALTSAVAFCTYFCMYAFRKPFAAAEYGGLTLWGVDYKIALILSQVAGYTLSKFIGVRVVAEMPRSRRAAWLIALIAAAEVALVGFALTPPPYNVVFMFLNGLPLGMIWGLVFAFLEGRQSTEVLAAALSASFIAASGVVKGIGMYTMRDWGVSEYWMPAVTGAIFLPPILLLAAALHNTPPPTSMDERRRTERLPMDRQARIACLRSMTWGILLLVLSHMLLTALRDYRDKFTPEILDAMQGGRLGFITTSEVNVMLIVLVPMGALMLLRRHDRALIALHGVMLLGFVMAGGTTLAFRAGVMPLSAWFVAVGVGLYLAYVPFHSLLFDRLVAYYRRPGNAGFLIYVADSTGYLSSVGILLLKQFGATGMAPLDFFCDASIAASVAGCVFVILALAFFLLQSQRATQGAAERSLRQQSAT